jgi:hypothetical protein
VSRTTTPAPAESSAPVAPVRRRRRRLWLALVAVLVLLAVLALAAVAVLRGGSSDGPAFTGPPLPSAYPADWLPPAGFPGPATTGVPDGVVLTPSKKLRITRDGTTLDGLDIQGCLTVDADDVTITRSRIRCHHNKAVIALVDGHRGLTVSDSELDGTARASISTSGPGLTLLRNDLHSSIDGPRVASDTVIEGNWVHDLTRRGDSHNDALQTLGAKNVVIRGNSLQAYDFQDQDPHNAALMISPDNGGRVQDLLVEGNYLDGGNVTVNVSEAQDAVYRDVVLRDNVVGPHSRFGKAFQGGDHPGVLWESNTWQATGLPAR